MKLKLDPTLQTKQFKQQEDDLFLSEPVYNAARKLGLNEALQMISYNDIFPDAFPTLLNWTEDEVNQFLSEIAKLLPKLEETNFKRGYGALGPK